MKKILLITLIFFGFQLNAQKKDIAQTPPMGWNSWNYFACDVSEQIIKDMADAMVSSGLANAGYEYIVIDDCWQIARGENDTLVADPERFPSGIKALADYVHSKGLKFGIYSDAGTKTCQKRPGSLGYEVLDARTFEYWGVDYLKYDWCYHGTMKAKETYPIMGKALYELDRPIIYSVCNWGWGKPWEWAPEFAHLWRTTIDIEACFDCSGNIIWRNVEQIIDKQANLAPYAKVGAWNDPDMLEVGNGLKHNENIAHFSFWCMMSAPLIAGNNLKGMTPEVIEVLTNKELIAINQDKLGIQATKLLANKDYEIWLKPLSNGDKAICFFNRNKKTANIEINLHKLLKLEKNYETKDLWSLEQLGNSDKILSFSLEENSVKVYKLKAKQ